MLSKTLALAVALFACTGFQSGDGLVRERGEDSATNSKKDSLEGKAPPALDMELWMNAPHEKNTLGSTWSINGFTKSSRTTKPTDPTWKSLEGKVVILDFWAYW